uniref:NIDO domain-containing protein n=1 Tax=Maylandia zebra TaxID=106582 RepID=A0A3P9CC36_9CICH
TTSARSDDGSSPLIVLQRAFLFFGQSYNQIYVNHNGHLTFDAPWYSYTPQLFPMYGSRDIIAPFWTDLDNRGNGQIYYNQYTSGSVLQQATQDINQYFPGLNFNANWVFVATWYQVAYFPTSGTVSHLLLNYAINMKHRVIIPMNIYTLKTRSCFFSANNSPSCPDIGWPVLICVDELWANNDGSSPQITLLRPFFYFGRTYNSIYVNHNGHLTFDASWSSYTPQLFPMYGSRDIIAPFWTDLDNRVNGQIYYKQYTSGSVLQQATQDINQYFPGLNFNANWVFVATWFEVAYYPTSGTVTVLISGGQYSFVLMNYGIIASRTPSIQVRPTIVNTLHIY